MAECPECGALLPEHDCERCTPLATLFATMTHDLGQRMDRRLAVMKKEILKAVNEAWRQGRTQ